jgi:hypothetical protein
MMVGGGGEVVWRGLEEDRKVVQLAHSLSGQKLGRVPPIFIVITNAVVPS